MELLGFDSVMDEINKLFRTKLCANTMGQVVTDAMVYPPEEGSPSYELYREVSLSLSLSPSLTHSPSTSSQVGLDPNPDLTVYIQSGLGFEYRLKVPCECSFSAIISATVT